MPSIDRLPSGKYRIRQMHDGKSYSMIVSFKPGKKEATQLMARMIDADEPTPVADLTVREAIEEYCRRREKTISPKTLREYQGELKRLPESILMRQVASLTDRTMQDLVDELLTTTYKDRGGNEKTHTPKTIKNKMNLISAAVRETFPDKKLSYKLPKDYSEEEDIYIPTDEDIKKLMAKVKGTPKEICILLACYGLRRSEICALTYGDIDFASGTIRISKDMVQDKDNKWVIKGTKTVKSTRSITVDSETLAVLERGLDPDTPKAEQRVYQGHPAGISQWLYRAQEKLGIPRFGVHRFRHVFASVMHEMGVPEEVVLQLGGWESSGRVMRATYRHARKSALDDGSARLADYRSKNWTDE